MDTSSCELRSVDAASKRDQEEWVRLPMGIRSNYPMCVSDFNFVMGAYNIYTLQIPLCEFHVRSEANRPSNQCDIVTVELAVEHGEISKSAEPKRVTLSLLEKIFLSRTSSGGVPHRACRC
jgi:hypothetical protein